MAKTVKITTDNKISIVDIPWTAEAKEKAICADCVETVKTQIMYNLFHDTVVMIVDESGIINNRPLNLAGSFLYGTQYHGAPIVGDILFGLQSGPEILPLENPEDIMHLLMMKIPELQEENEVIHIKREKIIEQLESLALHCESMIEKDDPESVWIEDSIALRESTELFRGEVMGDGAADLIKNAIEKEGINQKILAERTGITRQNVSQMLNRGKNCMRYDSFEKTCKGSRIRSDS